MRAAYDAVAEAYERSKTGQQSAPWSDALLERLADGLAPGSTVADLGCGHGVEAQRLAGRGLGAVGVDLSAGMLRCARARLPGRLLQGRVEQLPLRTGSVDGIWSLHALLHVDDLPAALAEVARVLRPAGLAALTAAVGDGATVEPVSFAPAVSRRFLHRPVGVLDGLLDDAGLTVLDAGLERDGRGTRWVLARAQKS